MRISCPLCGDRDLREFTYQGAALDRPAADASAASWDGFVHLRDNPAGPTKELWYHGSGCTSWLIVTRNTVTHEMIDAKLASEVAR